MGIMGLIEARGEMTGARGKIGARTHTYKGAPIVIAGKNRIGRLRRCVRRTFIVADNQPLTIGQILPRAYPRMSRYSRGHRWALVRALLREATVIARLSHLRGRPNLWAPKRVSFCLVNRKAKIIKCLYSNDLRLICLWILGFGN